MVYFNKFNNFEFKRFELRELKTNTTKETVKTQDEPQKQPTKLEILNDYKMGKCSAQDALELLEKVADSDSAQDSRNVEINTNKNKNKQDILKADNELEITNPNNNIDSNLPVFSTLQEARKAAYQFIQQQDKIFENSTNTFKDRGSTQKTIYFQFMVGDQVYHIKASSNDKVAEVYSDGNWYYSGITNEECKVVKGPIPETDTNIKNLAEKYKETGIIVGDLKVSIDNSESEFTTAVDDSQVAAVARELCKQGYFTELPASMQYIAQEEWRSKTLEDGTVVYPEMEFKIYNYEENLDGTEVFYGKSKPGDMGHTGFYYDAAGNKYDKDLNMVESVAIPVYNNLEEATAAAEKLVQEKVKEIREKHPELVDNNSSVNFSYKFKVGDEEYTASTYRTSVYCPADGRYTTTSISGFNSDSPGVNIYAKNEYKSPDVIKIQEQFQAEYNKFKETGLIVGTDYGYNKETYVSTLTVERMMREMIKEGLLDDTPPITMNFISQETYDAKKLPDGTTLYPEKIITMDYYEIDNNGVKVEGFDKLTAKLTGYYFDENGNKYDANLNIIVDDDTVPDVTPPKPDIEPDVEPDDTPDVEPDPIDNGVNGVIDEITTKGVNMRNGSIIADIIALSKTEAGADILKESITSNSDGTVTVSFKGVNASYTITSEEIQKYDTDNILNDTYSNGDNDILVIELAIGKLSEDIKNGKIKLEKYNSELKDLANHMINGGKTMTATSGNTEAMWLLTGKDTKIDNRPLNTLLDEYQNKDNKNTALSLDVLIKPGETAIGITRSSKETSNGVYSLVITNITDDTVTLINPYTDGKEVTVKRSELEKYYFRFEVTELEKTEDVTPPKLTNEEALAKTIKDMGLRSTYCKNVYCQQHNPNKPAGDYSEQVHYWWDAEKQEMIEIPGVYYVSSSGAEIQDFLKKYNKVDDTPAQDVKTDDVELEIKPEYNFPELIDMKQSNSLMKDSAVKMGLKETACKNVYKKVLNGFAVFYIWNPNDKEFEMAANIKEIYPNGTYITRAGQKVNKPYNAIIAALILGYTPTSTEGLYSKNGNYFFFDETSKTFIEADKAMFRK